LIQGVLKKGHKLRSETGIEYTINEKLGEGSQGEVYEVSSANGTYALKWYFSASATPNQKGIIKNLLQTGAPHSNFLWPMDIINEASLFGYVMPLRPKRYKGITAFLSRKSVLSFRSICAASIGLALGYQRLHSLGYAYCDISWGNAFIDPDTGDVLICDNDNVTVNGVNLSGVGGTLGFMAPEIIAKTAGPTIETDLFSLAVLLFYITMNHHPFEGALESKIRCLDVPAREQLYGTNAVFIWDPKNKANRPVKGLHDNATTFWDLYPAYIRALFTRSFTEGIKNPRARVVEKEWQDAFVMLHNSIINCPSCSAKTALDIASPVSCWKCKKTVPKVSCIKLGRHTIPLLKGTQILHHHLYHDYNLKTTIGEVRQHPTDPSRWGIVNLTQGIWTYTPPGGGVAAVEPGRTAPLVKGAHISFGPETGIIT